MKILDEAEIKIRTIRKLKALRIIESGCSIASEVSLHALSRRADLAVLTSEFIGIEVKSEFDTLKRLPEQLEAYRQVFDRQILVVHEVHLEKIMNLVTDDIDVWVVSNKGSIVVKRPRLLKRTQYTSNLLKVLTLSDLRILVRPLKQGMRTRKEMNDVLQQLDQRLIQEFVHASFVRRYEQTSAKFWDAVRASKTIAREHLQELSRFKDRREKQKQAKNQEQQFWANWSDNLRLLDGAPSRSSHHLCHELHSEVRHIIAADEGVC